MTTRHGSVLIEVVSSAADAIRLMFGMPSVQQVTDLADAFEKELARTLAGLPHLELSPETRELIDRAKYGAGLPVNHPDHEVWQWALEQVPDDIRPVWKYLPAPPKPRGRPASLTLATRERLAQMQRLVDNGMSPKPAADQVLRNSGLAGAPKNIRDHLLRTYHRLSRGK